MIQLENLEEITSKSEGTPTAIALYCTVVL